MLHGQSPGLPLTIQDFAYNDKNVSESQVKQFATCFAGQSRRKVSMLKYGMRLFGAPLTLVVLYGSETENGVHKSYKYPACSTRSGREDGKGLQP